MMNRRLIYRRVLLIMLAVSLIFSVYFINKHPFFQNENANGSTTIAVDSKSTEVVYPCGFQIGIYLETQGVMIIGTDEVEGEDGVNYSPALNRVKAGDYITKVNDIDVSSKSQLMFLINKYGNDDVILTVTRNGKTIEVKVTPIKTGEDEYKMGIWVRDDTQGIGTMTYLKSDGAYGTLGHGISDIDTGELLDSDGGVLYEANVWGIKKGEDGNPGALYGMISYEDNKILGEILSNTSVGIYGKIVEEKKMEKLIRQYNLEAMETAKSEEIKKGTAYIRSNVSGEPVDYEIEIEKISKSSNKNKGLVIKVTDERLLGVTNGIVQGMSGTPIIQNGKLIGAVTHVFVNDSTQGYGIFIENMLENN